MLGHSLSLWRLRKPDEPPRDVEINIIEEPENFGASLKGAVTSIETKEVVDITDVTYEDDPDFFGASLSGSLQSIVIREGLIE